MNVYYNLKDLPQFTNSVITIGSFDGIHNGHQKIVQQVNELATKHEGESIVITFHPHPRLIIYPKDKSLRLITTIEEKIALFEHFGIDNVVVVPFTVEFSQQSADEYIQKFLVEKFSPKCIVVGYDHKFGLNRQGDIHYLKAAAKDFHFEVEEILEQQVADITVSSTKIRLALEKGDVRTANELLGHPFTLSGKVIRGQQIGHTIGFPTANLEVSSPHKLVPPYGIYACQVLVKGNRYGGMLYIGDRPTLNGLDFRTIEVNIFDFRDEIYNENIKIECIDFIRSDQKFDDLESLKLALAEDKKATLTILKKGFAFAKKKK